MSRQQEAIAKECQGRRKVLVQIHGVELGGSQINAVDLAAAVRELGYDSVLIAPRDTLPDGPSLIDLAQAHGLMIRLFERPRSTLAGAQMLSQIAHLHGCQLVHTYGERSARQAYWGPAALARRPLITTLYEMAVSDIEYRATSLIVGTKYLEEELAHRRGPTRLISPPVDLKLNAPGVVATAEFETANKLGSGHMRIVIVSRLTNSYRPLKSTAVEYAMQCLTHLNSSKVELVVVGTGDDEARLRRLGDAINNHLGRRAVVFTGAMADPRPAYASATLTIGMGSSAARGLAFGKPLVVAGEFGWFSAFRPETAKALFRNSFWSEEMAPDPARALAAALEPLLESAVTRSALGSFGREFAEKNFGLKAMAERLSQVYDQALYRYRLRDWLFDLRRETTWAAAWLDRHIPGQLGRLPGASARAQATAGLTHTRSGEPPRTISRDR